MSITQQQQLALRRGLLYNTATNQLVTFNPVTANTSNVGNLPRTSSVAVTIPINAEGGDTTVDSVFPPSQPGATINAMEGSKVVTNVSIWNRVQGAAGSKYIFIRDILSSDSAPAVGDFVESHSDASDNMYSNLTKIVEINPTVTMKIIDLEINLYRPATPPSNPFGILQVNIIAVPNTPLDFQLAASECVGQKFIFTIPGDLSSIVAQFVDTISGGQENRNRLKELLGFTNFSSSDHTQVTFTNFINDVFNGGTTFKMYGDTAPSLDIVSGRQKGKAYSINDTRYPFPFVMKFEKYINEEDLSIFSNGTDLPEGLIGQSFNLSSLYFTNSSVSPADAFFNNASGFVLPISTVDLELNTGDGTAPLNETFSNIACDLLCYKLNKPLITFTGSGSIFSKTNVTNVVFGSEPVETQVVYNGDSIDKDSLLTDWEAGYHQAGRILQNKLKK
jgi:hypothetical protein